MPVMLSRVFARGVNLVGGGVVLVRDGAVGDGAVETHPTVDGLGSSVRRSW
jgi:hypothetical protein